MNVGLHFDLRNPPQWGVDPSRLYAFTLELCEEADHLGCHSLWFSEHHLFDDGYLPQPLTFATAVAARTKRARLGTAVVVAPFHHPAALAEHAAIVDLVSGGRLDLGIGAGYRVPEFDLFGADITRRYAATDGCARELRRLWSECGTTPQPAQARPPIWMGYQGPKGARRCGLLGESLLSADPAQWPHYRDALVESGHDVTQARMAGAVQAWTTNDPERDWPVVAGHLAHQRDTYRRYGVEGTGAPVPPPVDPEKLRQREPRGPIDYLRYGTPDEIAGFIGEHTAGAPVETVLVWASLSGMPEAMVAEHVRVVCTELAPRLARSFTPTEGAG